MKPIRIALTKGRLEKDTVALFDRMGMDTSQVKDKGRRLILPVTDPREPSRSIEVVLAKAADVITYVEHGVCDLGVVGKDTIAESGGSFYEVLDLGFGRCRFALAAPGGSDFFAGYHARTVASKYPNVSRAYFGRKGMDVEIIKIEGSVELAPLLGLSDAIVDIVETGSTLKENGLQVIEDVLPISARVIVNMACMKLRKSEIETLIGSMEQHLCVK
ncbi:MAG: ATP phosphoribosyltransferase [Clostridiales bacterium]|nr:ATP phosphoribosyltransferase [Clostridiales bacterium]